MCLVVRTGTVVGVRKASIVDCCYGSESYWWYGDGSTNNAKVVFGTGTEKLPVICRLGQGSILQVDHVVVNSLRRGVAL